MSCLLDDFFSLSTLAQYFQTSINAQDVTSSNVRNKSTDRTSWQLCLRGTSQKSPETSVLEDTRSSRAAGSPTREIPRPTFRPAECRPMRREREGEKNRRISREESERYRCGHLHARFL
ncbi:hypothetical protein KM043_013792 [Ampulex compressa]|nr:hypothetical protein KM043_013792 [Ampulex compressa]